METKTINENKTKYISCYDAEKGMYWQHNKIVKERVRIYIGEKFRVTYNDFAYWIFESEDKAIEFAEKLFIARKGLKFKAFEPLKAHTIDMSDRNNDADLAVLKTVYNLLQELINKNLMVSYGVELKGTASVLEKENEKHSIY